MNKIIVCFCLIFCGLLQAQQLNCTVTINTQKLQSPNLPIFKTLEVAIAEFVNKTDWNGLTLKQNEKVNCSMYITLSSYNSNQFVGTIQVQSSRHIYNSTYSSPVLNFNDKDFSFNYTEFESLIYNPTIFESNLVSVLSFYSYIILGMDADTFMPQLGNPYFENAINISNVAQQGGYKGWSQVDGFQSRYYLINDLLSPTFFEVRQTSYLYHTGLDLMPQDLKIAKEKIKGSLLNLKRLTGSNQNPFLTRIFFDAKSDEIVSIFSGGPSITITDLVDSLNKISPLNGSKWSQIKY